MNRIREHRERLGWSQAELARLAGTTQATIHRLESGDRQLTDVWMRAIAKAMNLMPADLITSPTLQDFREEARPFVAKGDPILLRALEQRALALMEITSDALENLGIHAGDVKTFDLSQSAVDNVKTGDVVVAQLCDRRDLLKGTTVIRQFIWPGLLTTNRSSTNIAFTMDNPNFEAAIKGVMVADPAIAKTP